MYHTATLEQILACKETFMCAGTVVVTRKLAEGKLSFQASCDVFMTQMKFDNYHMKHSEI